MIDQSNVLFYIIVILSQILFCLPVNDILLHCFAVILQYLLVTSNKVSTKWQVLDCLDWKSCWFARYLFSIILLLSYSHCRSSFYTMFLRTVQFVTLRLFSCQEHHLQRALSTQQVIPTPETISCEGELVQKLFRTDFKAPKQYIHVQGMSSDCLFNTNWYSQGGQKSVI